MQVQTGRPSSAVAALALIVSFIQPAPVIAQSATGPLTVHPTNPRYFADGQGRAVYLTGSHTWGNLQDLWTSSQGALNFNQYLDMLQANGHNFIRLWRLENPTARYGSSEPWEYSSPHPWARTGPGTAGDGQPKFNLNQFNQAYFDRLRQRCIAAGNRGMYVSVMLFEGHGLTNTSEAWFSHPFKSSNNINGINGDPENNNRGEETHTLDVSAVRTIQEAYVRKVIDTLNDLDNIFYEIANESHVDSIDWQNHFINYIKSYEAGKPQRHLVWYSTTFPNDGGNASLWSSNADVISPGTAANNGAYRDNPPANNGSKIIVNDTDHLWGCGGNGAWVWKCFTRGLHPIYMDGYFDDAGACSPNYDIREQMGYTRDYALRMNLANALPSGSLVNTGWCLADAGDAYLVYSPSGGNVTLNLSGASGSLKVEWFRPDTGQVYNAANVNGGGTRTLSPPFSGEAVVFVHTGINGDANGDGTVNVVDLLLVVGDWGACSGCSGDINNDGQVNVIDMLAVINDWS